MAQHETDTPIIEGFEDLTFLGKGGMAVVYRARRIADGEPVAIKLMTDASCRKGHFIQRFQRECGAVLKLHHPNIVRAFEAGTVGDRPYLVMELVQGDSAGGLVRREGALSAARALAIVTQTAEALREAHRQGYVHRDVKPSNILLDERGEAKLSDFGLAKTEHDPSVTQEGQILGTPYYLAPEQISGAPHVDARADIYSLGMTLFYLVAGRPAFEGRSVPAVLTRHLTDRLEFTPELERRLDEPLRTVILHLAAKSPANRYQDVDEVLQDLAWARGERSKSASRITHSGADYYVQDWDTAPTIQLADYHGPSRLPLPEVPAPPIRLAPGQVLFYEDDESAEFYWLCSGRVEVLRGGRRLALLTERGTVLGEMAALRGARRSATLRALSDCELIRVGVTELPHLLSGNPRVLRALLGEMADRIDRTSRRLVEAENELERLRERMSELGIALEKGSLTQDDLRADMLKLLEDSSP